MSLEYETCVRTIFYHKKGKKMKNEFKAGDLVFVVDTSNKVILGRFKKPFGSNALLIEALFSGENYMGFGYKATPENRQALVTLYGEDAVPNLPPPPHEITLKLLENQKYQLCRVSNHSTGWKHHENLKAIVDIGVSGEFIDSNGWDWFYGIPIDNNGNEITEIE